MKALVAKEFRLVVHPSTYALMLLGALTLIPSWMYGVIFIWGVLVAFFNAMNAREACDLAYSFSLPVSRRTMVAARIVTMVLIELAMLGVMLVFIALREPLGINAFAMNNASVGTAANLSLVGFGFALYGIFNLVFFPLYYRDPSKVGVPFMIACIPVALLIIVIGALPYLPIAGIAAFGVPGFGNLDLQLGIFAGGVAVFVLCSILAIRLAARAFSTYDA